MARAEPQCPDCGHYLIDYDGEWWHLTPYRQDHPALSRECIGE